MVRILHAVLPQAKVVGRVTPKVRTQSASLLGKLLT